MPNALQLPLSINFKHNYWTSFHLSLQLRLQLSLPANIAHVEVQTALNKSESKAKCVKYSDAHSSNTTNNNNSNKQNKSRESECVCERQMQLCKAGGVATESKVRGSRHGNPQLLFSICCCFSCCCCTNKARTLEKRNVAKRCATAFICCVAACKRFVLPTYWGNRGSSTAGTRAAH